MRGVPTVRWTCDRCGGVEDTLLEDDEPLKPEGWWLITREAFDPQRANAAKQRHLCDACDSDLNHFFDNTISIEPRGGDA